MVSRIENELIFDYIRSSGPGGQNVNKVSTAVQLRFNVAGSPSLRDETKARLIRLAGKRMTGEGVLVLEARSRRTQEGNRAEALARFHALIARASQPPRKRRPTRPTRASQEERLAVKKKRGAVKQSRRQKEWE
ncbi:MAG: alternative ribosome rescue aminoacyl-tRNA hydrolase ArfB [Chloroflexota bacterium]